MQWFSPTLITLIAVAAAALVVMLAPVRIELSAKGQWEQNQHWVLGVGIRLLLCTVSFAAAQNAKSMLQLRFLNLRLYSHSPSRKSVSNETMPSLEELDAKLHRAESRVSRWFDIDGIFAFAVSLRRQIRMQRFSGRLSYSTPDVAITGMLAGALYTVAGLLAPFGSFFIEPRWDDFAQASGQFNIACKVYPGQMLLRAFAFALKNIKLQKPSQSSLAKTKP